MKVQKFPDDCKKVHVKIRGIRPLLLNSPKGMETDSANKKIKTVNPSPEVKAETKLYKDEEGNIIFPGLNVLSCIRDAAAEFKAKGRKTYKTYVYSGLQITPENIPIQSEKSWVVDSRSVCVGGKKSSRIIEHRPKYNKWSLEFDIEIVNPDNFSPEVVSEILDRAGKFNGIGDFRPLFGLFEVEEVTPI